MADLLSSYLTQQLYPTFNTNTSSSNTMSQTNNTLSMFTQQQEQPKYTIDTLGNWLFGNNYNPNQGMFYKLDQTLGGIGSLVGTGLDLYGAWQGISLANKKMDLYDQQLSMAKEQWARTKQELDGIRKAKSSLIKGFYSGTYKG